MGIEVLYDGDTHRSMGLVGGLSFTICSMYIGLPYWLMAFLMATTITILEFIAGLIFNREYTIWDYRKMPFNIKGQVCMAFYLIWLIAMPPVIMWLHKILI